MKMPSLQISSPSSSSSPSGMVFYLLFFSIVCLFSVLIFTIYSLYLFNLMYIYCLSIIYRLHLSYLSYVSIPSEDLVAVQQLQRGQSYKILIENFQEGDKIDIKLVQIEKEIDEEEGIERDRGSEIVRLLQTIDEYKITTGMCIYLSFFFFSYLSPLYLISILCIFICLYLYLSLSIPIYLSISIYLYLFLSISYLFRLHLVPIFYLSLSLSYFYLISMSMSILKNKKNDKYNHDKQQIIMMIIEEERYEIDWEIGHLQPLGEYYLEAATTAATTTSTSNNVNNNNNGDINGDNNNNFRRSVPLIHSPAFTIAPK